MCKMPLMPNFIDLTGRRFGRFFVLKRGENRGAQPAWHVRCDCGTEKIVISASLRRGVSKSCGCLKKELARDALSQRTLVHGMTETRAYKAWCGMIYRCHGIGGDPHGNYQARGIAVCERWRASFENFYADMGDHPGAGFSIDRINNDLGYSPENCRWATWEQQANNTRKSMLFEHNGMKMSLPQWERHFGFPNGVLYKRITRFKWDFNKAISEPLRKCRNTRPMAMPTSKTPGQETAASAQTL